jgi:hypothetical protein
MFLLHLSLALNWREMGLCFLFLDHLLHLSHLLLLLFLHLQRQCSFLRLQCVALRIIPLEDSDQLLCLQSHIISDYHYSEQLFKRVMQGLSIEYVVHLD